MPIIIQLCVKEKHHISCITIIIIYTPVADQVWSRLTRPRPVDITLLFLLAKPQGLAFKLCINLLRNKVVVV